MADGLGQANAATIEAKYELGDDGKLSLSVYPIKDIALDSERNEFAELAGDPTSKPWRAEKSVFKAGDFEHLVRSSRDLTLVQLSKVSLPDASRARPRTASSTGRSRRSRSAARATASTR